MLLETKKFPFIIRSGMYLRGKVPPHVTDAATCTKELNENPLSDMKKIIRTGSGVEIDEFWQCVMPVCLMMKFFQEATPSLLKLRFCDRFRIPILQLAKEHAADLYKMLPQDVFCQAYTFLEASLNWTIEDVK